MQTENQKRKQLIQLAKTRQNDRLDPYVCLAEIHEGYYECDFVSPWTKSAQNINATLMILGKDWASTDTLLKQPPDPERRRIGQNYWSPTNSNLREYLRDCMGGLEVSETYSTNVFPFIKQGKKNESIPPAAMLYAAKRYALPQIEIISPRMVICLGSSAFCAVRTAAGLPEIPWDEAMSPGSHTIVFGAEVYGVWHPSNYTGGKMAVKQIWSKLGIRLEELSQA